MIVNGISLALHSPQHSIKMNFRLYTSRNALRQGAQSEMEMNKTNFSSHECNECFTLTKFPSTFLVESTILDPLTQLIKSVFMSRHLHSYQISRVTSNPEGLEEDTNNAREVRRPRRLGNQESFRRILCIYANPKIYNH
jgi:hypothetical protein